MLAPIFFFSVSLIGLIIASYTDLKERIVSNRLSYSLIATGLIGHAALAVFKEDAMLFVFSAIATAAAFAFAWCLWKLGVWAGGDVKLLTGIAALNPFNPNILREAGVSLWGLNQSIELPAFFISLFIFSVFAMLPYGALLALNGIRKREKERKEMKKASVEKIKQTMQLGAAVAGLSWILYAVNLTQWLLLPILMVLGLVRSRRIRIPLIFGLFLSGLFFEPVQSATSFVAVAVLAFGFYILLKLYWVSKTILREEKKISGLEEGDIIAESFIERNGKIEKVPPLEIKRIIKYFTSNRLQELQEYLQPKGRAIASSRKARGLVVEEIKELQGLAKEKKIPDSVQVKLSAPFVPAMLIAYLALNVVGDVIWALLY